MENESTNIETTTQTDANTVLAEGFIKQAVADFEKLDEQIRNYLYPILYKMFDEKKLNKGNLPDYKKASDSVTIREFCIGNDGKVSVHIDIHWRGDCYDDEWVSV